MKNIFIEYPKCSTCKKAKKWLEENNIEFIDRNSDKGIFIGFKEEMWKVLE